MNITKMITNTNANKVHNNIVITWGEKKINLGKFWFANNGSFHISSSMFDTNNIETGNSTLINKQFITKSIEKSIQITKGFHISLHPPDTQHNKGVFQIKAPNENELIYKIELDWHPVKKEFNLLHFFTLPLDLCPPCSSKTNFDTPILNSYKDSLEIIVNILPIVNGQVKVVQYDNDIWTFTGFSAKNYAAQIRLVFANQRLAPCMYYPVSLL